MHGGVPMSMSWTSHTAHTVVTRGTQPYPINQYLAYQIGILVDAHGEGVLAQIILQIVSLNGLYILLPYLAPANSQCCHGDV